MNLLEYKSNKYSSTGNDGIIEKIFDILGLKPGFFVEFGALDGIKGSNCKKLHDEGWEGLFIESSAEKFELLKKNYENEEKVVCVNAHIDNKENLFDDIVKNHVKKGIDFCAIDIDGLDVEIFETFNDFLPTVVCIEGGQMLEPLSGRVPEVVASGNVQQSLKTMVDIFEEKGYKLLCTYQDSFFIKKEYYDLFSVSEDLVEQYLDGLIAIHRRMPWIQFTLNYYSIKNKLINYILLNSNYYQYGYENRKKWAVEQEELTLKNIQELKNKYCGKRESK